MSGKWKVLGRATTKEGNIANPGLRVQLWDKDASNVDEFLGEAMTDDLGEFSIEFKEDDFTHWGSEEKPDLYLIVLNNHDFIVYSSEKNVIWEAKEEEYIYVRVPKDLIDHVEEKKLDRWEQIKKILTE